MELGQQPQMPQEIGRFRLLEPLGEGAMSVVYKAFDPEINRTLAIKLLRGEFAADPEYRYRFLQEAKAAGKLTHPNIVTIFDVGETPEGPYIAMEYLEGATLEEMMESDHRISLREVVIYGIQLAEALDYSHARGIVHRDVKPGNIISPQESHNIKITDFGIAHMETPNKEHRTKIGAVLGTPQYMSPEQVEGQSVDGRSDLFSLGVILYQLITGDKPFVSETLTSLLLKIVQDQPIPIESKVPDIPNSLQKIIKKLLSKQPAQRFQTGKELADALRNVVHEIDEIEEHKSQAKILPLRVKWTAVMAVVVAAAMILGSYLVYKTQFEAMTAMALDSGGSLADFIAIESAEAVLIQDWVAIEALVNEIQERQQIDYLKILDHKDIIRVSTYPDELGSHLEKPQSIEALREDNGAIISERFWNEEKVFDFHVPVLFQNKRIGSIQLGLSQEPLMTATDLTLYTMLGLLIMVVVTVVIVAYLLAAGITGPMKLLRKAMAHIIHENYNYRITQERNDELGLLFSDYNRMASTLAARREAEAAITKGAETEDEEDEQTVTQSEPPPSDAEDSQDEPTRIMRPPSA
jgi:serine/threonine-protein kinase